MVPLLVPALAALLAQTPAAAPTAPPPEPVRAVVLPPVFDGKAAPGLELALQEKATALLLATGRYEVMHARQVAGLASNHMMAPGDLADPGRARLAAERLGAKTYGWATLKPAEKGWELSAFGARVGEAAVEKVTAALPAGEAALVEQGGTVLAQVVAKLDGVAVTANAALQPATQKDAAMRGYAACTAGVSRQPLGIENPPVLDGEELARALQQCEAAVRADASFQAAWAALALVSAVNGRDARAVEALGRIDPLSGFLPSQVLARFWLVTRFQSPEDGEAVLREAMQREPGFLLPRVYLAELCSRLGRYEESARLWQDYARRSPSNTYVISRLASTLSRLGKPEEAVGFAEKALRFDPQSPELRLELAARYIEAGKHDLAIALLEPMAQEATPNPEALLRLGFARAQKGQAKEAEALFVRALKASKEPRGWRVRFRALLDLAVLAHERGDAAESKRRLNDALKEGRITYLAVADVKTLERLTSVEEALQLQAKVKHPVKQATPFQEGGAKPAEPRGFEAVKVKPSAR